MKVASFIKNFNRALNLVTIAWIRFFVIKCSMKYCVIS